MLHHSHVENSDSKQRRKQHCHQMHDKPKYENGGVFHLPSNRVGYILGGILYVISVLFRLTAYSLRKPFKKLLKKIDVHSVFKNGFIQRNSLFVVWVLQLVRVFLLWSAVLPAAEVGARSLVVIVWNGRGESSVVELSILPSLLQVFMLERDAF